MAVFKNILVLVDESDRCFTAIDKALALSDRSETTIHIVKIINGPSLFGILMSGLYGKQEKAFRERKLSVKNHLRHIRGTVQSYNQCIKIQTNIIIKTVVRSSLKKFVTENRIDLAVLIASYDEAPESYVYNSTGNLCFRRWGIPVLTVFEPDMATAAKALVIPVSGHVSLYNIQSSIEIARKFHLQIYLVAVLNKESNDLLNSVDDFYDTYKHFLEYGSPVQYKILSGDNKSVLLISYAMYINAGMIFSCADSENNFLSRLKQTLTAPVRMIISPKVISMNRYTNKHSAI